MAKGEGKIAKKYARALFELVLADISSTSGTSGEPLLELEKIKSALEELTMLWEGSEELRRAMASATIPLQSRETALREIAGRILPNNTTFSNFCAVLLVNHRLSSLRNISEAFGQLVNELRKLLAFEVTSAFEISDGEKCDLETNIQKQLGNLSSGSSIAWHVDKELLGGLTIKVGDRLLDSSIRGSLDRIKAELI